MPKRSWVTELRPQKKKVAICTKPSTSTAHNSQKLEKAKGPAVGLSPVEDGSSGHETGRWTRVCGMKKPLGQGPQIQSRGLGGSTSQQGFCGSGDLQEGPSKGLPHQSCSADSSPLSGTSAPRRARSCCGLWRCWCGTQPWGPWSHGPGMYVIVFPLLPAWFLSSRWVRRTLTWPSS